jgi:hypothetical protein
VNTPIADSADAFMMLFSDQDHPILLLIQEKQSIISKRKVVEGIGNQQRQKTVHIEDIKYEIDETVIPGLKTIANLKVFFIFLSDNDFATGESGDTAGYDFGECVAIAKDETRKSAFGKYIHKFKLFAVSNFLH